MRTYKEPKRIDKARIRDSAIRQLNANAAKFAAIRSAAESMKEDESQVEESNNHNSEFQASGSHILEHKNHIICDIDSSRKDSAIETHTSCEITSSDLVKSEVVTADKPIDNDDKVDISDIPSNSFTQEKDSSFSSSSIPTDSFISSSSKSSDLDSSINNDISASLTPSEENRANSRLYPSSSEFSQKNDKTEDYSDEENNSVKGSKISPPVKKKISPKQSKKKGKIVSPDKQEDKSENQIKNTKKSEKQIKSKKSTSNLNKRQNDSIDKKSLKLSKSKAKSKVVKTKKSVQDLDSLEVDCISEHGDKSEDRPDDQHGSVSPRSSKRTPKKNRKYQSDEENLEETCIPLRKRSPRGVRKRKLNFDEEELENIDGQSDLEEDIVEECLKAKAPPQKKKKLKDVVVHNEDGKENNDNEGSLDMVKPKAKRGKKAKSECPDKVNEETKDDGKHEEKQNDDAEANKSVLKRKPGKKAKKKIDKSHAVNENLDADEKSEHCNVKSGNNDADSQKNKKKRIPKKKVTKSQESGEQNENLDNADVDDEDPHNDSVCEEDKNKPKDSGVENMKDQVAISCPLCGHVSHSKSANTRHIKRCVEIPRENATDSVDRCIDFVVSNVIDGEGEDDVKEEKADIDTADIKESVDSDCCENEAETEKADLSNAETKIDGAEKNDSEDEVSKIQVDSDNIHKIIKRPHPDAAFKCEHCEYSTPKRAMLGRHLRTHGIFVCLRCNFICDTRAGLKDHVYKDHKDRADYKLCRKCSRYVKCHEISLEKHMETCQGPVPFKCNFCEKEFKYESSLKSHVYRHNPDAPKRFHCTECSYESNYKANLKKHLKNIHGDKSRKEIKCPMENCGKVFHTDDHLKRHLKFHSEDRPHCCDKCSKRFRTAAALRGHAIVHDPSRPFKCNINDCTKDFRSKKLLKNHMEEFHNLTEKKYPCDYEGCKFAFFKRSHLERHKITHTGERRYGCTACGKAFRHSDNLKIHMRQHTNEKPEKCDLCDFACRQKSSLQYHLRKFHGILPPSKVDNSNSSNSLQGQGNSDKGVVSNKGDGASDTGSSVSNKEGVSGSDKTISSTGSDTLTMNKTSLSLKQNHEKVEKNHDTKPLSPLNKSQNPIDLYEFRSDEEFDDDSLLMPLRQDKTSTPIKSDKISTSHTRLFSEPEVKVINEKVVNENSEADKQSGSKSKTNQDEEEDIRDKNEEEDKCESENVKPKKIIKRKRKLKASKKSEEKTEEKLEEKESKENVDDKSEQEKEEKDELVPEIIPKPKGKRGRKPKAKVKEEDNEKKEKVEEEKTVSKPPRKKPGPKPKKDKEKQKIEKMPKKRGPKKKKVEPIVAPVEEEDDDEEEEEVLPPRKKRKYVRKKKNEQKTGSSKKKKDKTKDDNIEEEETIIYSELDQNTANDDDDGEATEIEGFNEEVEKCSLSDVPTKDEDVEPDPPVESEKEEEKPEEEKPEEEEPEEEEEEKPEEEEENEKPEEEKKEEKPEEEEDEKPEEEIPEEQDAVVEEKEELPKPEEVAKEESKEGEEVKHSEDESERISSGIDTDFEDDLKPPPAPRPPPVVDSDEGDIESGPEEMDTPGRDFESTPPKSVQNHSVQSYSGRDYESTPPKSVQPDSVPNYGSIENKNDVMSPEIQPQPSVELVKRNVSMESQSEDRELSNPMSNSMNYPPPGSVELPGPGSVQGPTQPAPQNGSDYLSQSESTMPEVDKEYLGQYLQQFDSAARSEDDQSRLNAPMERPPEHINIPTSPQGKELPPLNLSSSVPPLNLTTSGLSKPTDMSNKRMEILASDRQHEDHFQPRVDNPSRSSERIPDNVYESLSSMTSYIPGSRETPNLFPPTSTSSTYMPFTENDALLQRQRMTTPFLTQSDPNALQNLHRMADSALATNNPASLLRRPTTVPSREEIFPAPSAVAQTMARNPFHTSWTTQDVRHPHWSQPPYLQRSIDRQSVTASNPLFGKDNYLTSRDFMFDTSRRSVTERNMFAGLPRSQRPELSHETFPGIERFDFGYFGSHGYPTAPPLDYTRSSSGTAQKTFDERYRQTATGMSDFRGLPQTSTADMFRTMNPTFNLDKYMYGRDPVYHTQHVGDSTNSPFLPHGVPTQHAMFDRDYTRGFYQNSPYSFMNDKPYAAAAAAASAKLTHPTTPGVGQERDFVPRPNTAAAAAADSQMQDPYRHPMLYNMMNRFYE